MSRVGWPTPPGLPGTILILKLKSQASLVAQWLRICLPMQGTWVRALVREDPTCHGATKPVHHNYWACALEPASHNYWSPCTWSLCSTTRKATAVRSLCAAMMSSPSSPQLEKVRAPQWRPNPMQPKNFFKNPEKPCTLGTPSVPGKLGQLVT